MKYPFLILIVGIFFSCSNINSQEQSKDQEPPKKQRPIAYENGKFIKQDGKELLYGGEDSSQHFNIGNLDLKKEQFHYGIGREAFPALLEPEFISVAEADELWEDDARFLVAYAGDEVKAYSVKDLTRHEVVNDELNGDPIMAVYCVLADLGAIYERTYGDEVLTFALSGYTYYDDEVWDGLDGFVLWDRETESLWWPLVDKAVSGPLKNVGLLEMDRAHWEDTNWETIKKSYPNAKVLKSGQDFERPDSWDRKVEVEKITAKFKVK
ncbi:DUF3179 domain-containing (seleno)protein [Marivirga sp.]|uniref:DUF3179 domain-containing (seleno)protein n=1 Tax=Marivirga sp. TaxID=2018662 RepID=UPI003DA73AED